MGGLTRAAILLSTLLALTAALAPTGASARLTGTVRNSGMFNKRYCELLVLRGVMPKLTGTIWASVGLNDCPDSLLKRVDTSVLAGKLGAIGVRLNGPRFILFDRMAFKLDASNPEVGTVHSFDGLRLRAVGTLPIPIAANGLPGIVPYTNVTINRYTTFSFSRNHLVHELVAPDGRVYVMHTYSQIVDKKLTLPGLTSLASRLAVPAGWHYRLRKLKADLTIKTGGARWPLLQDEMQNSYQLER